MPSDVEIVEELSTKLKCILGDTERILLRINALEELIEEVLGKLEDMESPYSTPLDIQEDE